MMRMWSCFLWYAKKYPAPEIACAPVLFKKKTLVNNHKPNGTEREKNLRCKDGGVDSEGSSEPQVLTNTFIFCRFACFPEQLAAAC